jgi:hypothetical protein
MVVHHFSAVEDWPTRVDVMLLPHHQQPARPASNAVRCDRALLLLLVENLLVGDDLHVELDVIHHAQKSTTCQVGDA